MSGAKQNTRKLDSKFQVGRLARLFEIINNIYRWQSVKERLRENVLEQTLEYKNTSVYACTEKEEYKENESVC